MGFIEKTVSVAPESSMHILAKNEVRHLLKASDRDTYNVFRRCALAVLNCGVMTDDAQALMEANKQFDIEVIEQSRGIKLALENAPDTAFVDGRMIRSIKEHLFSVLRDVIYVDNEIRLKNSFDLNTPQGTTDAVFQILRNADILRTGMEPGLVVCWGGHSISRQEYDYTKEVGHAMGLRGLNICTGCGPGAMKGPMKGATIGHAKQRRYTGRYIGMTEPGIIAAESPNPIVNELVILPDIEKRLEAFVRAAHGIVVFPGGAGTAEEILYLLGIMLHPDNAELPFPILFTGPDKSADYFKHIHEFIGLALGEKAQQRYQIINGDPHEVARTMTNGCEAVYNYRRKHSDAYYFNWLLRIDHEFQKPFEPTHDNMKELVLSRDLEPHKLAANLRRAFSGIVAGNVKDSGIRAIKENGPYKLNGEPALMKALDALLKRFVDQGRMKLGTERYNPCYELT